MVRIMTYEDEWISNTADRLCALYDEAFGGKVSGRYRIPAKLLRELAGKRRLYEDDILKISRAMVERSFILIDMDSFYVVMSANTFVNYRRANEDLL